MKPRHLRLTILRRRRHGRAAAVTANNSWRALSLCWKRSAPRAQVPMVARHSHHLHQSFTTQLLLNLAAPQRVPRAVEPHSAVAIAHPPRPARESATVTHQHTRHLTLQRQLTHRATERVHFETRREVARSTRVAPASPGARIRQASPATAVDIQPRNAPVTIATHPLPRTARAASAVTSANYTPRSTASAVRHSIGTPARALRPAAMVWHEPAPAPGSSAAPDAGEHAVSATTTAYPTARALASPATTQDAAQVQNLTREAQRTLLLDPALTERLAEDVMRRVDKRLRIERERRGL